jgi:hypothetical protein
VRFTPVIVVAALALAACGTVSTAQATKQWMSDSAFTSARATLVDDAKKSVTSLTDPTSAAAARRTICQVLFTDAAAAVQALPSPDAQANALLGSAYTKLSTGATACYRATGVDERSRAAATITAGVVSLGLGSLRLTAVTAS